MSLLEPSFLGNGFATEPHQELGNGTETEDKVTAVEVLLFGKKRPKKRGPKQTNRTSFRQLSAGSAGSKTGRREPRRTMTQEETWKGVVGSGPGGAPRNEEEWAVQRSNVLFDKVVMDQLKAQATEISVAIRAEVDAQERREKEILENNQWTYDEYDPQMDITDHEGQELDDEGKFMLARTLQQSGIRGIMERVQMYSEKHGVYHKHITLNRDYHTRLRDVFADDVDEVDDEKLGDDQIRRRRSQRRGRSMGFITQDEVNERRDGHFMDRYVQYDSKYSDTKYDTTDVTGIDYHRSGFEYDYISRDTRIRVPRGKGRQKSFLRDENEHPDQRGFLQDMNKNSDDEDDSEDEEPVNLTQRMDSLQANNRNRRRKNQNDEKEPVSVEALLSDGEEPHDNGGLVSPLLTPRISQSVIDEIEEKHFPVEEEAVENAARDLRSAAKAGHVRRESELNVDTETNYLTCDFEDIFNVLKNQVTALSWATKVPYVYLGKGGTDNVPTYLNYNHFEVMRLLSYIYPRMIGRVPLETRNSWMPLLSWVQLEETLDAGRFKDFLQTASALGLKRPFWSQVRNFMILWNIHFDGLRSQISFEDKRKAVEKIRKQLKLWQENDHNGYPVDPNVERLWIPFMPKEFEVRTESDIRNSALDALARKRADTIQKRKDEKKREEEARVEEERQRQEEADRQAAESKKGRRRSRSGSKAEPRRRRSRGMSLSQEQKEETKELEPPPPTDAPEEKVFEAEEEIEDIQDEALVQAEMERQKAQEAAELQELLDSMELPDWPMEDLDAKVVSKQEMLKENYRRKAILDARNLEYGFGRTHFIHSSHYYDPKPKFNVGMDDGGETPIEFPVRNEACDNTHYLHQIMYQYRSLLDEAWKLEMEYKELRGQKANLTTQIAVLDNRARAEIRHERQVDKKIRERANAKLDEQLADSSAKIDQMTEEKYVLEKVIHEMSDFIKRRDAYGDDVIELESEIRELHEEIGELEYSLDKFEDMAKDVGVEYDNWNVAYQAISRIASVSRNYQDYEHANGEFELEQKDDDYYTQVTDLWQAFRIFAESDEIWESTVQKAIVDLLENDYYPMKDEEGKLSIADFGGVAEAIMAHVEGIKQEFDTVQRRSSIKMRKSFPSSKDYLSVG